MSNGNSKGTSPVVWALIGCGGCLVLVLGLMAACGGFAWLRFGDIIEEAGDNPAKAAAMMVIRANPDLELVDSDDAAGTFTIRDKDGKTFTIDWDEIKEGRFSVTTDEGEMSIDGSGEDGTVTFSGPDGETATFGAGADLDDVPDWLPRFPDIETISGAFSSSAGGTRQGGYGFVTDQSPREAADWFVDKLTDDGFKETSRITQEGIVIVSLANEGKTVTLNAAASGNDGETLVNVGYEDKQ